MSKQRILWVLILFTALLYWLITIDTQSKEHNEPSEEPSRSAEKVNKSDPPITLAAEMEEQIEAIEVPAEVEEEAFITVQARVTAYAPLDNKSDICAEGDPTVTATGSQVRRGIVAVDPKKISYGTKVYIPGYGEAVAEDTGGALRRYDGIAIDILVDTYSETMQWGKQYLDIIIYD